MTAPVHLKPLVCIRCSSPISARMDEVAWVCEQCQQGQILNDASGLQALEIHFANGAGAETGKPFWIVEGQASLQRTTFGGSKTNEMNAFWQTPRSFFVPAYPLQFEQVLEVGIRLLRKPPVLQDGPACAFYPVTVSPEDVQTLAEFMVLSVEAERKDDLKELGIQLRLSQPVLWVLPNDS